jgi:hypothetical protein
MNPTADIKTIVLSSGADFLDFGCSSGGSLEFGVTQLGGTLGLGIDVSPEKVAAARKAGHAATVYNLRDLPEERLVRFVIMSRFLEHVSDVTDVRAFIEKACRVASEFVYIQQPFFDADAYLFRRGLKLFWSDWSGHPNRMSTLDLWSHLRSLRASGVNLEFVLFHADRIADASSPYILPISAPPNQHEYDACHHPEKDERIKFDFPVYRELRCLIQTGGTPIEFPAALLRKAVCVYASSGVPNLPAMKVMDDQAANQLATDKRSKRFVSWTRFSRFLEGFARGDR